MASEHENDRLTTVLTHISGQDLEMGLLHPAGSMLKTTASFDEALISVIKETGVEVKLLEEVIMEACTDNAENRALLEEAACAQLSYDLVKPEERSLLLEEEKLWLSDEYKKKIISGFSLAKLINIITTRPKVLLEKSLVNNPLATSCISFTPLSNLFFMRDQTMTTAKGLIFCAMNSPQRRPEVDLMKFVAKLMGLKSLGSIAPPSRVEGCDFFPAGKDLCFIGCGARTNYRGVVDILNADWFGTTRVAVVRDVWDRNEKRLWLDKVFNIIDDDVVVVLDKIISDNSHHKRLVDEWTQQEDKSYKLTATLVDFHDYLKQNNFKVIPVPERCALPNVLNLGNGNILTTSSELKEILDASPDFNGKVTYSESPAESLHSQFMIINRAPTERESRPHVNLSPSLKHVATRPVLFKELVEDRPSQTTDHVLMVAPTYFTSNEEAKLDNFYMLEDVKMTHQTIRERALEEYSSLYYQLRKARVRISLFTHQPYHCTPDACFPNNWISTHSRAEAGEKTIVLYPMKVSNRRKERRPRIVQTINRLDDYRVISLSDYELHDSFLEGTGALCLDRINKIAYVCRSARASEEVLGVWAKALKYNKLCVFDAVDAAGRPIYHTNVMMAVGTSLAIVCMSSIKNKEENEMVRKSLESTNHEIIDITHDQVAHLCGNCIELRGTRDEKPISILVMSKQAYDNFLPEQRTTMLKHVDEIIKADISTIEEIGGGGVRCCIGEVF